MAKTSGPEANPTPAVATPPIESISQKAKDVRDGVTDVMFSEPKKEELTKMEKFWNFFGYPKDNSKDYKELTKQEAGSVKKDDQDNDILIQKKKGEISQVEEKLRMNVEQDEKRKISADENLASINKSIEEAKARGDDSMVELLEKTKNSMQEEEGLSNSDGLKKTKETLEASLKSYQERKVIIVDDFIGNIDMKIGDIKLGTYYQENLGRRKEVDSGIEQLSSVINGVDIQVVSLKKALSFARSKEDKAKIKESIDEYVALSKESKVKLQKLEAVRVKLSREIDATDKRTRRFEDLKYKYLNKRDSIGKEPATKSSAGAETGPSSSTTESSTESDSEGGESWYTKEDEELVSKAIKRDEILESIEKLTKTGRKKAEDISKLKVWLGSLVDVFKALKAMSILESGEKDKIKKQEDLLAIISNEIKTTPPPKITPAIYDKIRKFSIDAIAEFKS